MKAKGILKIVLYCVSILVSAFFGGLLTVAIVAKNPESFGLVSVTKTEKEVTVVENGISDAVDKVYDSVVVVKSKSRSTEATGTGFIYSKDDNKYYIVTNFHVISGATAISIVFTNNVEVEVVYEGGDQFSDIAVLSYVSDKELEVAPIGESINMNVGDTVFAIGAPLDSNVYSWSVTRGILSGKDREVRVSTNDSNTNDYIMNVLQTDAAINSGNSGGPLCNSNGEVVGVTNMKLITSGVEGMGFAIPIEEAKLTIEAVIKGEEISRPYIGVHMLDASDRYNQIYYGLNSSSYGVLITEITAGKPADVAGLEKEDIIVGINDVKITDIATFRYQLYKYHGGDKIKIKYIRNGKEYTTDILLEKN